LKRALLAAVLFAAPAAAADTRHHHDRLLTYARLAGDYARSGGEDVLTWDGEGWIGGDKHKFWWKTEGDHDGSTTGRAEFQALYSRNVWTFFDIQAGIRHDIEPDARSYAVIGVQGLAPYLLETELHAYIGFAGDVHFRARQTFDVLLTNRFIVTPGAEADLYLTDVPERRTASGFARVEAGVQARYEFTRKFAPYVAVVYDSKIGETARLARAAGEDAGGWRISSGLRLWF
jgi:copper resistance protein B